MLPVRFRYIKARYAGVEQESNVSACWGPPTPGMRPAEQVCLALRSSLTNPINRDNKSFPEVDGPAMG
jgi:hypothetical protein